MDYRLKDVIVISIICFGYFFIGLKMGIDHTRKQAESHHCAQYNPKTAEFEWIGGGK